MMIGTLKGFLFSGLRSFLIYSVIRTSIIKKFVPFFLMLNIPFGTLDKVRKKERGLY